MILRICQDCNTYKLKGQIRDGVCSDCRKKEVVHEVLKDATPTVLEVVGTKQCSKCKKDLGLDHFSENKRTKDKLNKCCKNCE